MRVLQISADRSKRGDLMPASPAATRQKAYAHEFGDLENIGFSLLTDGFATYEKENLRTHPTNSASRFLYGFDAMKIARRLPRPDVVSAQDPFETGLVAWWIARRLEVPLHVQLHTDFLSPQYARHSFTNRLRVLSAGFVLRRASRVRVVSERIKNSIEKRYDLDIPITVLPIFADVSSLRNAKSNEALAARFANFKTKLLVVARLESEKNVALALRSFAQIAPQGACLIVVGEGSERAGLERLAKELDISERVFFEGEQPSAAYYSIADLVLVTSRYEGYGLVIVEALAAGKPVLSTDVGVAREVGAIVVAPGKFTAALSGWFANGSRTAELKNYPYKDFEEYVRAYCADVADCVSALRSAAPRQTFAQHVRSAILACVDVLQFPRAILAMRKSSFVLLYHGVTAETGTGIFNYRAKFITPEAFRAQIRWLKRRYRIVPLVDITNAIAAGKSVPRGMVAITFDDGYENNFAEAYPILKEENVPATFFVATDFVGKEIPLPVDIVEYAIGNSTLEEITLSLRGKLQTFSLRSYQERVQTDLVLRSYIKTLSSADAKAFLDALVAVAGPDLRRDIMQTPYRPVSWENIREMEAGGMAFAAHTCSHPILSRLSPEDADAEIKDSSETLRAHTTNPLAVFAYPNGGAEDFNADVVSSLKKNGFTSALTTLSGTLRGKVDPFRIPRYTLDGSDQMYRFRLIISGAMDTLARLFG